MVSAFFSILLTILFLSSQGIAQSTPDTSWQQINEGLHIASFPVKKNPVAGDGHIQVVRINPAKYQLTILSAANASHGNLTADAWCKEYQLIAAINAGMFQTDYQSNVGYMKHFKYLNNARKNAYQSVAAFNPVDSSDAPFRIFDLDSVPFEKVTDTYQSVIQNLRLIKRPGENRWSRQEKRWSEAALGEDDRGNILLIFSRTPFSMHEFNNILLALPINLQCAQHLEGGPEASLYFSHRDVQMSLMGSYETDFNESDKNHHFWELPNVIGVLKK